MPVFKALLVASASMISTGVFAADYRAEYQGPREYRAPPAAYVPYVAPVYLMPSPPQYVQDVRTGAPGRWVQLKTSFLDRLLGEFRDEY